MKSADCGCRAISAISCPDAQSRFLIWLMLRFRETCHTLEAIYIWMTLFYLFYSFGADQCWEGKENITLIILIFFRYTFSTSGLFRLE